MHTQYGYTVDVKKSWSTGKVVRIKFHGRGEHPITCITPFTYRVVDYHNDIEFVVQLYPQTLNWIKVAPLTRQFEGLREYAQAV